jgi:hypothetical protein
MPQKCGGAWIDTQDDKRVGELFQFDEFFVTELLEFVCMSFSGRRARQG